MNIITLNKEIESMSSNSESGEQIGSLVLGQTLGQGEYGLVKEAIDEVTGEKVAVKILDKIEIKQRRKLHKIKREIAIMKKLRHPHIAQLYQVIETESNFYLVMEHCTGGALFDYIVDKGHLEEEEAAKLFQQLLSCIEYMHSLGVTHRDLKPENILLDQDNNIKVIDFGLGAEYREGQQLTTICGSPMYVSPEMVTRQPYNGLKVDIWSAGVTLFAMLCGYLPFQNQNMARLKEEIRFVKYQTPDFITGDAEDLIRGILIADPEQRPIVSELRNHCWFKQFENLQSAPGLDLQKDEIQVCSNTLDILQNSYGMNANEVEQEVKSNQFTERTATYYLIFQKSKQNVEEEADTDSVMLTGVFDESEVEKTQSGISFNFDFIPTETQPKCMFLQTLFE